MDGNWIGFEYTFMPSRAGFSEMVDFNSLHVIDCIDKKFVSKWDCCDVRDVQKWHFFEIGKIDSFAGKLKINWLNGFESALIEWKWLKTG